MKKDNETDGTSSIQSVPLLGYGNLFLLSIFYCLNYIKKKNQNL
jgi:hypothetical protein